MPKNHRKPERELCPCCRGAMRKKAVICGFCWGRLPQRTQQILFEKGMTGWDEKMNRFTTFIAQGKKPEEIHL